MRAEVDPRAAPIAITLSAVLFSATALDLPVRAMCAGLDPALRAFWRDLTVIGDSGWMLGAAAACAGFAALMRAEAVSRRWRAGLDAAAGLALFVAAAVAVLGLIAAVAKLAIGRPRPKLFETAGPFDVHLLALDYKMNSWPSGHATTAFAFATALALIAPRWRPLIYAVAVWGAVSRVAVGAHYVSDVVAGAALGFFGTRALARAVARRGWAFDGALRPRRGREAAAAMRLARRRLGARAAVALETAHDRTRAALRRRRADEE